MRRRQWHPTPVLLPGESHGGRSLVGYSPWGRKELDSTEQLHFHFHFSEEKTTKNTNSWRLNNTLPNNEKITEEIRREIKKFLKQITTKTRWPKTYGIQKINSKGEVYSNTILPQEKHQRDTLNLQLKQLQKEKKNPKVSRRKQIIKIREEINEKEMKETVGKINKIKSCFFEKINKIDKPLARLIKKKKEGGEVEKSSQQN